MLTIDKSFARGSLNIFALPFGEVFVDGVSRGLTPLDGPVRVYEGSHVTWSDPSYNIATGLAFTTDLRSFTDLTPDAPILRSTTPGAYHTWRYSHWLWVGEELWVYAEVARANNTNEIRLFRLPQQP